ncbi:hypothetical protein K8P63_16095 [Sphingomonas nostoxanthinifaciens]|nr:hypothetical protein K8P63_16095 [Sphingomonas nostoxanthinifaciens]
MLGRLAVKGAGYDARTEQFEAVHFGLDEAAAMVATLFLPELPAEPLDGAERFVTNVDARTIFLPWRAIPADRKDSLGMTLGDRGHDISSYRRHPRHLHTSIPSRIPDRLMQQSRV